METNLLPHYAPLLKCLTEAELEQEIAQPAELRIDSAVVRSKTIEVAYAPFDHINREARVVIVGLTPGRQQMRNALVEARRALIEGESIERAAERAKVFASFSGPLRNNLVDLLNDIGVTKLLGLEDTRTLWDRDSHLVHFTSALRYPVFVNGSNYSGAPDMLRTSFLRAQLNRWFVEEMKLLPNALYVPLGPKVGEALLAAAEDAGVDRDRVLAGLPHPSGASAERISYFLGRKRREDLSAKTNPDKLDLARTILCRKIQRLEA